MYIDDCVVFVAVSSCAHGLQRTRVSGCPDRCLRSVPAVSLNQPNALFNPNIKTFTVIHMQSTFLHLFSQ